MLENRIKIAAEAISKSQYTIAFTGAGISAESGIPPFRGEDGIWTKYNPEVLDIDYFIRNPENSWLVIKELFYEYFMNASPNMAHIVLARLETAGKLNAVVTQNIDNLHQLAGNKTVYEFHGNTSDLECLSCGSKFKFTKETINQTPPLCSACGYFLKPGFIFFGEPIPPKAYQLSFDAARKAQVVIIAGTTGEVMPAGMIPYEAHRNGATIIEINTHQSAFTTEISHIFLQGKATQIFQQLGKQLNII